MPIEMWSCIERQCNVPQQHSTFSHSAIQQQRNPTSSPNHPLPILHTWSRMLGLYHGKPRPTAPSNTPSGLPAASASTRSPRGAPKGAPKSASNCRPWEQPPVSDSLTAACTGERAPRGAPSEGPSVQARTAASKCAHCHLRGGGCETRACVELPEHYMSQIRTCMCGTT